LCKLGNNGGENKDMKFIIGLLIFIIGAYVGIALTAIMSVNKISDLERQIFNKEKEEVNINAKKI
jgi:hypothetical protein